MENEKVNNTENYRPADGIERGIPGEQFRYEVFTTVMNSIEAQRDRLVGLTEEQRLAEFRASEESPAKLAELRATHDALQPQPSVVRLAFVLPDDAPEFRIANLPDKIDFDYRLDLAEIEFEEALEYITDAELMTRMTDVSVAPPAGREAYERLARARDEVAVALAEVQRYKEFTTVMGTQSDRDRLAGLTEDQRVAEFVASELHPVMFAQIRAEHDSQRPQILPVSLEELRRAETPELRVDTTTVLPDNLEELLRAETPELRVDTTTVLPDNLEELLRAETPELRVDTTTVLPDNLEELLRAEAPELRVDAATVLPDNLEELLRAETSADQHKFEAWQGVMGSLDSEKPRMAILSVVQRRAEYAASQIGPERFQQVRAEHDRVNGYGATKPTPPEKGSLAHWANELTEAANKNRRPLSGSEFKQVVSSIENCSRGADMEKAKAREVAGLLAKVHGPSGESLFRDPELRNAYKSAIAPERYNSQAVAPGTHAPMEKDAEKSTKTVVPTRMR
ncbi:hypothetical protein HBO07_27925 [Pseudomonas proteolytica]|uniref:hypothetical protein n=1 Tax=Pseudomonas proteolytica TaxID=219574 RepID=UPI001472F667|nr:hypothetical protein [Pseudomonas proteolytica]NMZ14982.1 hypothetical protein [Pseudomonas proteolytica]NMZ15091.1 hypothetical protein [Pseudomonas proteolytica]